MMMMMMMVHLDLAYVKFKGEDHSSPSLDDKGSLLGHGHTLSRDIFLVAFVEFLPVIGATSSQGFLVVFFLEIITLTSNIRPPYNRSTTCAGRVSAARR